MPSSDLIKQITDRIPSGSGIYLRSGDKVTAGVLYYSDCPIITPFFEIHTGTSHVASIQEFWKKHVSSHQIEDDSPTDQQLLERLSINFQDIDAAGYPKGTSETLASMLATEEHAWFRSMRRIDAFKMGAFDRIYEKLDFGTTLCYMGLGSPPLYLTLERRYSQHTYPGNIVLTASEDQPANIDLSRLPSRKFNHLNHVSNWYKKNVMGCWRANWSPLYDLYIVSGPYKGRNMGQLLDDSPLNKVTSTNLFPPGSKMDMAVHVASIDYMLKKMDTLCRPCRVINVIKIMKYVLDHSVFVNSRDNFKKTVVAKARQFLKEEADEPALVAQCQLVVQMYDLPNVVEVAVVESNSSSVASNSSSSSVAPAASNSSSAPEASNPVKKSKLLTADEMVMVLRRTVAELEQKNATLKAMLEASLKTL
uniref:Uncharacterized protein n=1 Tax=viral metagenome TaxID=1070528 RepID=A0A6C0AQ72_9ZZZZ